jgi:putative methanogenesis marker protein 17
MDVEVSGADEYGNEAYRSLFENIMSEVGKAVSIERARVFLDPKTPLFVFTVILRDNPESKRISDAASIRTEGKEVFVSISDENYAPEILSALWRKYGRDRVDQQTRFDVVIENGDADLIANMEIASGEDAKKEIIGALWRVIPEGIKARYNLSEGRVITIAATEEIVTAEIKEAAMRMHNEAKGDPVV